jgi:hypothetical protein
VRQLQYRFRGTVLSDGDIPHVPEVRIVAVGPHADREGVVEAFDGPKSFHAWAEDAGYAHHVESVRKIVAAGRRERRQDLRRAERRHRIVAERIRADLEELAEETGLALHSEELFLRATSDRPNGEPPIFGSAMLYDHPDYQGGWIPLAYTLPDFRWLGFNDLTSSYRWETFGVGVLWEHIWYGGDEYWIFGPRGQAWIGSWFDNKASSGIIRYEQGPG